MWPLFKSGDLLIVRPVGHFRPGELYVYKNENGETICHRLHRVRGQHLIFKGDACIAFDRPVPIAAVLGAVVLATRHSKRIALEKKRYELLKYGEVLFLGPLSTLKSGRKLLTWLHNAGYHLVKRWHFRS